MYDGDREDVMIVVGGEHSTGHCQLSHKIGRYIQERIGAGDLFLPVLEAFADWLPFGIALGTDDILVAITFEIDHVVVLFELVQLDINEDPDSMGDVREPTV